MKKALKLLLIIGIICIIIGVLLYFYNQNSQTNNEENFFMLELTVGDNKATIEPKKQLAQINNKEINLTIKEVNSFSNYFLDYFQEIKNYQANENVKYLWAIKYQAKDLTNYYLGADEYPEDWDNFIKAVDKILDGKYFTKKTEIKQEEDLSVKSTSNINFIDSCNAYNCTYSVKTDTRTVVLEYMKAPDSQGIGTQKLLINNNELISDDFDEGGPVRLKVLGDIIVILYQYGTLKENRVIKAYNINGKELFVFDIIDPIRMGMYIYEDDFEVKDNYILIKATREIAENKIRINDNISISYCSEDEKIEYEIDDSSIISATYKIAYVDNDFTTPEIINSTTLLSSGLLKNCQITE